MRLQLLLAIMLFSSASAKPTAFAEIQYNLSFLDGRRRHLVKPDIPCGRSPYGSIKITYDRLKHGLLLDAALADSDKFEKMMDFFYPLSMGQSMGVSAMYDYVEGLRPLNSTDPRFYEGELPFFFHGIPYGIRLTELIAVPNACISAKELKLGYFFSPIMMHRSSRGQNGNYVDSDNIQDEGFHFFFVDSFDSMINRLKDPTNTNGYDLIYSSPKQMYLYVYFYNKYTLQNSAQVFSIKRVPGTKNNLRQIKYYFIQENVTANGIKHEKTSEFFVPRTFNVRISGGAIADYEAIMPSLISFDGEHSGWTIEQLKGNTD